MKEEVKELIKELGVNETRMFLQSSLLECLMMYNKVKTAKLKKALELHYLHLRKLEKALEEGVFYVFHSVK